MKAFDHYGSKCNNCRQEAGCCCCAIDRNGNITQHGDSNNVRPYPAESRKRQHELRERQRKRRTDF